MPKPKTKPNTLRQKRTATKELEGVYLLKLVLYVIVGAQWFWLQSPGSEIGLPIGLVIGILFARHEHFQVDRKIEYAVLLVATVFGYIAHSGLFYQL